MSKVCVSDAFTIVDGALGLAAWTGAEFYRRRVGAEVTLTQTGAIPTLPGIELWDMVEVAVNEAHVNRLAVFRLQRPIITLIVPQPNAMQVRDRWEVRVAPRGGVPDIPGALEMSTAQVYNGAWTASADSGTFSNGTTRKGRMYRHFPGPMVDVQVTVPPDHTAAIRWMGYVWTPPPWSNNADAGNATGNYACTAPMLTAMLLPTEEGGAL